MRISQNTKISNGIFSFQVLIALFNNKRKVCNFFWGGWKSMMFDFSIFKESLLAKSQVWIFMNSALMFLWRFASSANKWNSSSFEELWNSLMYNRNNEGPRTDSCGILNDVLHFADDFFSDKDYNPEVLSHNPCCK